MTAIGIVFRILVAVSGHEHIRAAGKAALRGAYKELIAHVKRRYKV